MPVVVDIPLLMTLVDDSIQRGKNFLSTGQDLMRKGENMLAYAQAHCDHEFIPPLPAHAHEGGVCKHCRIGQLFAAQHRRQWLAAEDAGLAPWTPQPRAKRPAKTKTLADVQQIGRGIRRTDQ